MAAVIHGAGLAGLMLYVTHDVGSRDTADRVAWTEAVNLPVDDAPSCAKLMRRTVTDAGALKAAAGVATNGRKLRKPFEHMSIVVARRAPTDEARDEGRRPRGHPRSRLLRLPGVHRLPQRPRSPARSHRDLPRRPEDRPDPEADPRAGSSSAGPRTTRSGPAGSGSRNRRERRLVREHNA